MSENADAAPVTAADFGDAGWQGRWLWLPEEPVGPAGFGWDIAADRPESHGLFRKTFMLESVPARAPARITADSRYLLYANGREVCRGPIRSQPRRMHYDLFDLAPYLRSGENTLAVYVVYYGRARAFWMPAPVAAGLGSTGIFVLEANLGDGVWIVSDASWRAKKGEAWSAAAPPAGLALIGGGIPIEILDAQAYPLGWEQPGYDDRAWGIAQVVRGGNAGRAQPPADPYGPLFPRPIAALSGEERAAAGVQGQYIVGEPDLGTDNPVRRVIASLPLAASAPVQGNSLPLALDIPSGSMARLMIDMGRIVSGFVHFSLAAPAGTVLEIQYTEEPLSERLPHIIALTGARYTARGTADEFEFFGSQGFRYAYVLVHGVTGPVTLRRFGVREHLYPWQGQAGFACSDDGLTRIYTAGVRTVALNSHDAFIDCPTREQRAFTGDSVVHQMVHLVANFDWRLAWHYLTLGNSPRADGLLPTAVVSEGEAGTNSAIPDWSLHWLHGVYNLYRYAGDRDAVSAYMPSAARILRWYAPFQTAAGVLKDVTEWNLVDWSAVSTSDTSSTLTALWARGLAEFGEMAGWLEERYSQRWAQALHARAVAGFEMFWDEARGSYVDHVVEGDRRPEMSQLAGALAIVSGLAPQARWARIVDTITDSSALIERAWGGGGRPGRVIDWDAEHEIVISQPFMQYVVHDAVARAGLAERLPELYRRWSAFLVDGYDTIGENWSWGTHVHGWSCTPTRDMISYTLGVTPAEPGYTRARIAPRLGRLAWAQGKVPSPHGLIDVRVEIGTISIDSPVPVALDLPGVPTQELPAGRHTLAI